MMGQEGFRQLLSGVLLVGLLSMTGPANAVDVDTVLITNAGNVADTLTGLGAVAYRYRVGLFEVTNDEYAVFLNAVAPDDSNGLYNNLMSTSTRGGIFRGGEAGAYTYTPKPNFGQKPVIAVSWFDAARFCNWLHNQQPSGNQDAFTTEDGAYNLGQPDDLITRAADAQWHLCTHAEWYKAAYFDPFSAGADAGGTADYWMYPTSSDVQPTTALANPLGNVFNPGPNVANHSNAADWNGANGNVTTVGTCTSMSPWGLFDLAGNANEWTESLGTPIPANPPTQPDPLYTRMIRGGDFANPSALMSSPADSALPFIMAAEGSNIGFRVARRVRLGDNTADDVVDVDDLVQVILNWGICPPSPCAVDGNDDGQINVDDLIDVILNWD